MINETDETIKSRLLQAINTKAIETYRNATGVSMNNLDKMQFRGFTGLLMSLTNFR